MGAKYTIPLTCKLALALGKWGDPLHAWGTWVDKVVLHSPKPGTERKHKEHTCKASIRYCTRCGKNSALAFTVDCPWAQDEGTVTSFKAPAEPPKIRMICR